MARKKFTFPTEEDIVSVRARTMLNIGLGANKERTHVYKRWSEKATIVSYNSKNDTYSIIVSSLNVSSSTRKQNRTIRDVKAIIPSKAHQFSPGDSVLIGYETDKRESPVILGLRKGSSSQVSTGGGGGGGVSTPSITPPCDLRFIDDSGNILSSGNSVICDCSKRGSDGTMSCSVRVECAVGQVRWAWSGQGACGSPDCFTSAIGAGTNATKFSISKGICEHIDPLTGSPFLSTQAASAKVRCFRFDNTSGGGACTSGCNITYFNCDGVDLGNPKISICGFGGDCRSDQPEGPPADCCLDPALLHESAFGSEVSDVSALIPSCGSEIQGPPVTGNDLADRCGWFEYQESGQNLLLVNSSSVVSSMRSSGCCPCTISDGTTITARDSIGRSITLTVKVQVAGDETILEEGDDGFSGNCSA